MGDIIIIGAGGHAKVVADIACKLGHNVLGFLDDNDSTPAKILGFDYLGCIDKCTSFGSDVEFVVGIGDNNTRQKIVNKYDLKYAFLVHPSAQIGLEVSIGDGTVVMANAVVNSDTTVGKHCILNSGCIVEHDNVIADFVHLSPNATLCGRVSVGERTWIGAGATVKNGVAVCGDCVVGTGGVVVKNIVSSGTYIGIPVRSKR